MKGALFLQMEVWPAASIPEPPGRPGFGIDSARAKRYRTLSKISRSAVPGMHAPVREKPSRVDCRGTIRIRRRGTRI